MARLENVALRASAALAGRPRALNSWCQAEKNLLSVLTMP